MKHQNLLKHLPRLSKKQFEQNVALEQIEAGLEFRRAFQAAKDKLAADATFQRDATLTAEERGRRAIDEMAREVVEWNRKFKGIEMSFEDAKEYIVNIATRAERKRA